MGVERKERVSCDVAHWLLACTSVANVCCRRCKLSVTGGPPIDRWWQRAHGVATCYKAGGAYNLAAFTPDPRARQPLCGALSLLSFPLSVSLMRAR